MFAIPITWTELLKRTYNEFTADNCLGLAAQLAYYLLLALVPALVFLISLTSFFPPRLLEQMLASVATFAPPQITEILQSQIASIAAGEDGGLLTFGFVMALWSSSAAVVSVTDALNRAYDIEEGRPWWKVRLIAIMLTLGLAALILVSFALVIAGPTTAEWLAARTGLGVVFEWTWKLLQWPLVLALVTTALGLLNYYGPDAEQDWTWVSPGALLGAVLWLLASLAFKIYVSNFSDYNATYGSLGGVIVLLLWFYISGLAVLAGAEMNAEIEHASPHGKDAGEKVPGERKKLGARAARAYSEQPATKPDTSAAPSFSPAPGPGEIKTTPARAAAAGAVSDARVFLIGLPAILLTWFFRRKRSAE